MIKNKQNNVDLKLLNTLLRYQRPMTTTELCDLLQCDRKSIYSAVVTLELNGFSICVDKVVFKNRLMNSYAFDGIHGFNEV